MMTGNDGQLNRAVVGDPDEVFLFNSVFSDICGDELRESDKHEIIVKICEIIGPDPSNFRLAEEIFDRLKFEIARFVIHHEYCRCNSVRSQLLLWLDSKINPHNALKLSRFGRKYLK